MTSFTKRSVRSVAQNAEPGIGLALSGGSTLGIAHIGALRALAEADIPIACVSGTSAGSIVATCHAFGMTPEAMLGVAKTLDWKKLSKFAYSRLGINTNAPLGSFMIQLLGDVRIEDARVPLAIVATDLESHETVVFREGSVAEAIRASACIPGLFVPVTTGGRLLVDGALRENLPLSPLRRMGAQVTVGVNLAAHAPKVRPKDLFGVITASIGILSQHRDRDLARQADVVVEPELAFFDETKFARIDALEDAGYRAMRDALPAIRAALDAARPKPLRRERFWTIVRKLMRA